MTGRARSLTRAAVANLRMGLCEARLMFSWAQAAGLLVAAAAFLLFASGSG